jgi:hypothetical protein
MVRTAGGSVAPLRFVVSGETTVFEDENYLLVRFVRRATRPDTSLGEPTSPAEQGTTIPGEQTTGRESADRTTAPAGAGPSQTSAEDVLTRLQQQHPEEIAPISAPPSGGRPLVNRPGRLVRQGDWWTFVFESDHPDHPEPPIKLLPNKSVELMMDVSKRESHGLVFLVSGEKTSFEGQKYLLPTSAMLRIDTGNLRP